MQPADPSPGILADMTDISFDIEKAYDFLGRELNTIGKGINEDTDCYVVISEVLRLVSVTLYEITEERLMELLRIMSMDLKVPEVLHLAAALTTVHQKAKVINVRDIDLLWIPEDELAEKLWQGEGVGDYLICMQMEGSENRRTVLQ